MCPSLAPPPQSSDTLGGEAGGHRRYGLWRRPGLRCWTHFGSPGMKDLELQKTQVVTAGWALG